MPPIPGEDGQIPLAQRKGQCLKSIDGSRLMAGPCENPKQVLTVGTAQPGKEPLFTVEIRKMIAALPSNLQGARDRALLVLGFAGGFRRSELAALNTRRCSGNRRRTGALAAPLENRPGRTGL